MIDLKAIEQLKAALVNAAATGERWFDPAETNTMVDLIVENQQLRRASRTRDDYDLRCQRCGAPHWFDTSMPNDEWNKVVGDKYGLLCLLCIDELFAEAGVESDQAEFYFVGQAVRGKPYAESHGEVAALQRENKRLRRTLERLADPDNWSRSYNPATGFSDIWRYEGGEAKEIARQALDWREGTD